jgi:hypothetical protein
MLLGFIRMLFEIMKCNMTTRRGQEADTSEENLRWLVFPAKILYPDRWLDVDLSAHFLVLVLLFSCKELVLHDFAIVGAISFPRFGIKIHTDDR